LGFKEERTIGRSPDVAEQDAPAAGYGFGKKEAFYPTTGVFSQHESGGQNFGIVENEQIVPTEQPRQVRKCAMFNPAAGSSIVQKARGGADWRG
jgi:hypothetical protein